jgi:hypothetical protein
MQACAALGLNASAALYYGAAVDALTQVPPDYVIDEGAATGGNSGGAPRLTAARYVPMLLNMQATELVTAGDHAAALQVRANHSLPCHTCCNAQMRPERNLCLTR